MKFGRHFAHAVIASSVLFSACVGAPPTPCVECEGVCVDTQTDSRNCGGCGTACAPGAVCRAGACMATCATNLTACGNVCVDTKNNAGNCGACGTACTAGEVCNAGACVNICPVTQQLCGAVCATLDTDIANCGVCGRTCPTSAVCVSGSCRASCGANQISCDGGTCVSAQTDNTNCGACGVTCNTGEVCSNATCGTTCAGNLSTCTPNDGGVTSCADTQTDNANCGMCGRRCNAGETCASGTCSATCGLGLSLCTQIPGLPYCAALPSDNVNCGVCGTTCATGESCTAGRCATTCGTGRALCGADAGIGGQCVDTMADRTNCGACGTTCGSGEACVSGTCRQTCGIGTNLCTASNGAPVCANLENDTNHCGACGATCAGTCGDGFCRPAAPTVLTTSTNFSTVNLGTRTCAQGGEMVRYSVTALTTNSATVSAAPAAGCLAAGDEVLLINLQGTTTSIANVGSWELLRIASITGSTMTFSTAKTKFYGSGAMDDANLGTARTTQRVIVQRVPSFSSLTFGGAAATYTADAWDGVTGGVFALRASQEVIVNAAIDMRAKGYTGAPTNTVVNTSGTQGESLSGLGVVDDRNTLAAGGGGRGDNTGCGTIGSAGAGAGHAVWGGRATSFCGGAGGAPIGTPDLARIFLGTGGSSGGTDAILTDSPPGGAGGRGGGIVMLLTPRIDATRVIDLSGADGVGDPQGTNCAGNASTTSCWDNSGPGGGGAGGSFFSTLRTFNNRQWLRYTGGNGGDGRLVAAGSAGRGSYGRAFPLPTSCLELHATFGDGDHVFAFQGDVTKPYFGYCQGVGSSSARMYLTVWNRSNTTNHGFYATPFGPGGTVIRTTYTRIRFEPSTQRLVSDDYTFSTSTGTGTGGPFGTTVVTRWPLASGGDCFGGNSQQGNGSIDLRGLPFSLSANNQWAPEGAGPGGTTTFGFDRQTVNVTGGGNCGDNSNRAFVGNGPRFGGEHELAWMQPRASCAAIKAANAAATDGFYTVQVSPSIPAIPVFCDMTFSGGGWMLLEDNGPTNAGVSTAPEAVPVMPAVVGYTPQSLMRIMATSSTQVHVRTINQAATRSFTTNANAAPIVNLRNALMLNAVNYALTDYTGTVLNIVPNPLNFGGPTAPKGWPSVYHASNNSNGFHWLADQSSFVNTAPENLQLWVR